MEFVCPHCSESFDIAIPIAPVTCPACEAEVPVEAASPIEDPPDVDRLSETVTEAPPATDQLSQPLGVDSINLGSIPPVKPLDESAYPEEAATPAPSVTEPASTTAAATVTASETQGVSKGMFLFVATWASIATIVCVYLVLQLLKDSTHQLESLPDLAPPKKVASLILIPEDAEMAPKHTLRIGEQQRYGSLLVKVLKVTREPASFVSLSDQPGDPPSTTEPLLKLWLSFENVSESQTFAPLDMDLVNVRELDTAPDNVPFRANQFVSKLADKSREGKRVLLYELIADDEWRLKQQELGKEVGPGDTLKTFLATVPEELDDLKGDLVWRVHFRKGYNPESGRGVTTLIEVRFHSDDITLPTAT